MAHAAPSETTGKAGSVEQIPDMAAHLLVVDDDDRIRDLLHKVLIREGFRVTVAGDAAEARKYLTCLDFDLMILDVMMPGEDGVSLTKDLRDIKREVPILMLTALTETENRVDGLGAGADDYLGKPFDPRELILRINNILKRVETEPQSLIEQLVFGPFNFSIKRRELKRGSEVVKLTERERDIMVAFATNPGETVSRYDLVSNSDEVGERTIDVQINRLRRKIEEDPANPRYLQTIRGIGYRLATD
ncbi:MAG: response regulator transcription factor [Pseudomonadota bacterium]